MFEKILCIKKKKKKRMNILKNELSFCKAIFKNIKNYNFLKSILDKGWKLC